MNRKQTWATDDRATILATAIDTSEYLSPITTFIWGSDGNKQLRGSD